MKAGPFLKDWNLLLREHWRLALPGFTAGVVLWLALGTLWPKHYSGSALMALSPNPQQQEARTGDFDQQVRERVRLVDWAAIVTRFRLFPELTEDGKLTRAAARLASQVSFRELSAPELGGAALRLNYSGNDRALVKEITEAIAKELANPVLEHLSTPAKAPEEPLYAPVILPDVDPVAGAALVNGNKLPTKESQAMAALTHKVQVSLALGAQLQLAFNQNETSLNELRADLRDEQKKSQAPATPKAVAPAALQQSSREERLRGELTKAERELAALQERYTDEYPDVVAASERVRDLKLDLSRIVAATPTAPKPQPVPKQSPAETAARQEILSSITRQVDEAEAAQSRLSGAIQRNRQETARFQAELASLSRRQAASAGAETATAAETAGPPLPEADPLTRSIAAAGPPANPERPVPLFFLVQGVNVTTSPGIFIPQLLWALSLIFGIAGALLATWFAERRDPSIRNELMLQNELPASAVYLGGIPRIRHEVIAD